MHDPMTVAHEIKYPWKRNGYRQPFLTIWHVDPKTDGSDDSCGWFMRSRHCDAKILKRIQSDFRFAMCRYDTISWFKPNGMPNLSTQAIVLQMFQIAANNHFGHWSGNAARFLRRNCYEILLFAENNCDSMVDSIESRYGENADSMERRADNFAGTVYAWLCRAERPWWKHPKWHIHHWKLQFHPWQQLKRRWWDKCCVCGKRGFKGAAIGSWGGDQIWHMECDADHPARVQKDAR